MKAFWEDVRVPCGRPCRGRLQKAGGRWRCGAGGVALCCSALAPAEPLKSFAFAAELQPWPFAFAPLRTISRSFACGGHGDAAGRDFVLGGLPARAPAAGPGWAAGAGAREQPSRRTRRDPQRSAEIRTTARSSQLQREEANKATSLGESVAPLLRTNYNIAGGSSVSLTASEARVLKLLSVPFWIA